MCIRRIKVVIVDEYTICLYQLDFWPNDHCRFTKYEIRPNDVRYSCRKKTFFLVPVIHQSHQWSVCISSDRGSKMTMIIESGFSLVDASYVYFVSPSWCSKHKILHKSRFWENSHWHFFKPARQDCKAVWHSLNVHLKLGFFQTSFAKYVEIILQANKTHHSTNFVLKVTKITDSDGYTIFVQSQIILQCTSHLTIVEAVRKDFH